MNRRTTLPLKTARFAAVVAKCGRPSVHLTLIAPDKDQELRRLDRQHRVMTLHQAHRGGGADHGLAGINAGPDTQRLVFPKSLRRFAGRRIVGVNYELLDETPHVTGRLAAAAKKSRRAQVSSPTPIVDVPLDGLGALSLPNGDIDAQPGTGGTPPPASRPSKPKPVPPSPPTMAEVLQKLRAMDRLLQQRKFAAARTETRLLAKRLAQGLERD